MAKIRLAVRYIMLISARLSETTSVALSTAYMRIKLWLYGAELGASAKFFGNTHIFMHPTSTLSIGDNCTFRSSFSSNTIGLKQKCFISTERGATIQIGDNCGLSGTVIASQSNIRLGNRVLCGANVTIADSDRHPLDAELRAQDHRGSCENVSIKDDVWIGMNTVILKGVTIGEKTIIAANSLVNKSLPGNVLAGGIPAKVIKEL